MILDLPHDLLYESDVIQLPFNNLCTLIDCLLFCCRGLFLHHFAFKDRMLPKGSDSDPFRHLDHKDLLEDVVKDYLLLFILEITLGFDIFR